MSLRARAIAEHRRGYYPDTMSRPARRLRQAAIDLAFWNTHGGPGAPEHMRELRELAEYCARLHAAAIIAGVSS